MTEDEARPRDLVVEDILEFAEECDKRVKDALFEWRAYYRDEPEYVEMFERNVARELMRNEYDAFKRRPDKFKVPGSGATPYKLTVSLSDLEDHMTDLLREELRRRGDLE